MRKFIEDNKISFSEGERNSSVVTLIGFAQFKELSLIKLKAELEPEINKDSFIEEEIDRLWNYCKNNNYKKFWSTPQAIKQYKF